MAKTCSHPDCNNPVFSKMLCLWHWNSSPYKKPVKKKITPPKAAIAPIKPKKAQIAMISKTRQEALKKYRRLRDKYFEQHPVCEFPDCNSTNITLHHKRGRIGAFLTDKRYFCSLCVRHHAYIESHPLEAQKLGLSQKRLEK